MTAFQAEGCGGGFAADFIKKGRGWRRRLCRRIMKRKVDGPPGRRLWPPGGGRLCRRVVKEKVLKMDRPNGRRVLKFDGLSGRGLWWRLRRKFIKVSVTGLAFYVIWYDKHSADWLAALASPYPAAPDFPPHPGDRINRSMLSCRDMAPRLSIHSPTTKWWQGNLIRKEP